jgi:hypothetical protein
MNSRVYFASIKFNDNRVQWTRKEKEVLACLKILSELAGLDWKATINIPGACAEFSHNLLHLYIYIYIYIYIHTQTLLISTHTLRYTIFATLNKVVKIHIVIISIGLYCIDLPLIEILSSRKNLRRCTTTHSKASVTLMLGRIRFLRTHLTETAKFRALTCTNLFCRIG